MAQPRAAVSPLPWQGWDVATGALAPTGSRVEMFSGQSKSSSLALHSGDGSGKWGPGHPGGARVFGNSPRHHFPAGSVLSVSFNCSTQRPATSEHKGDPRKLKPASLCLPSVDGCGRDLHPAGSGLVQPTAGSHQTRCFSASERPWLTGQLQISQQKPLRSERHALKSEKRGVFEIQQREHQKGAFL